MIFFKEKSTTGGDVVKLTASKVGVSVITLLISMLLSRFRTLEEYGTYSQMTLVINLFTTIFMLGLPNSLNYFLAKADTNVERKHFLSVYYTLSTILSLIVGLFLVAITPLLVSYFKNPLLFTFWYYLALFPWTRIITSGIENILVVYKRASQIILFRVCNSLAILGSIVWVQLMRWDFVAYMKIYLGVEIVFSIIVYATAYYLADGLNIKLSFNLIKKIFAFSIPMGLASMVGTLNIELDKLMIGNLLDTEQLAIYTNASKEMPITFISASITAVLLPQIVQLLKNDNSSNNERAIKLWGHATNLSFSFIAFLSVALVVFAPEVITFLYSEKYLPGISVFRVYSVCLLLRFTYWGMIINAKGRTKFILYSSLASLILNVLFNYLFYIFWGMIGPAIATLLSQMIMAFVQLFYSAKILKVSMTRIFPWLPLGKILLTESLLGSLIYLFKIFSPFDTLISKWIELDTFNGKIVEAFLLGIIWLVIFLMIEFKNMKESWLGLNNTEDIKTYET